MDIRKRIERQEGRILKLTDELEKAKEEYDTMQKELEEQEKKEIFEAYKRSKKNYAEVIEFLKGKADIWVKNRLWVLKKQEVHIHECSSFAWLYNWSIIQGTFAYK